jgi:hypothetical protein
VVADSGETLRTGTGKPVNLPSPINVEEDAAGMPASVTTSRKQAVAAIIDWWRIDDEWWRSEPVSRFYYTILLAAGRRITIYKNILTGEWFRQF